MKVGDLVVCNCKADTWYKGLIGTLIDWAVCTRDPLVMYENGEIIRLAKSGLEIIHAS